MALLLNGLLPNEAASAIREMDSERWHKAEERTAELIACIQPNPASEERRNAVADYVQRLIKKCFPCQVFAFGSGPLKTYLPDGDIDLTAFCKDQNLEETWAYQVCDMLENEMKDENAQFRVKAVEYIAKARVKIIKCLVENIVVDISFNQLGGLCTLCFLVEVDHLINQNHLFKRSIILIKAWCYYESHILGSGHGLISTYALETLVLYIFHVFNNSFAGPLQVLYRFLEVFSKFDWDNFCVSLWGPVPISSLPDVTAERPRKDGGGLLLSKSFLDACSSAYAVVPGGQENQGQPFVSKHFNVVSPLCINENLGRSVSKGNFFRIRSAFALGAERLARLLDCPKEDLFNEVNQFFINTWARHGSGRCLDAPRNDLQRFRLSKPDNQHGSENVRKNSSGKRNDISSGLVIKADVMHGSPNVPLEYAHYNSESTSRMSDTSTTSLIESQMGYGNWSNARIPQQISQDNSSNQKTRSNKRLRSSKPDNLTADVWGTGTGTSDASTSHFSTDEGLDKRDSGQNFDLPEVLDHSEVLSTTDSSRVASVEPSEHKPDILDSDFASHWQNLQCGRSYKNSRHLAPLMPPVYLQGHFPWDGPGRPLSNNLNLFNQLTSYGSRLVPVAPLQSVSNRPTSVYQRYVDDVPRYRSGTHTFLPNPKVSVRERHSGSTRRGNYSYERSDHHGDREGNWNLSSKPQAAGRSHNHSQADKPTARSDQLAAAESRTDRPWGSHRNDSFPSYQSQNGPLRSNSRQSGSANVAYGRYPVQTLNPSGVSSNGPNIPPVVMLYPYDQTTGYGSPAEQLEFGSLGQVGFSGMNETSQLGEGSQSGEVFVEQRFHGGSGQHSSPDQPSSPHL